MCHIGDDACMPFVNAIPSPATIRIVLLLRIITERLPYSLHISELWYSKSGGTAMAELEIMQA